ncbi:TolB family protein [Kribbella sp. NPDC058245]|uniref:TolB family protein n=1 Tax=Kribbella sp. NPDC058245 TaxID=3346399 RepID=UPI0036E80E2B
MRALVSLPVVTLVALVPIGASAWAGGPPSSGQIVFSRYDPASGEPHIVIADPSGRHERGLALPLPSDNPIWSPDGSRILVFAFPPDGPPRPATVRPDGSGFRLLKVPALPQDADVRCTAWSRRGKLLCQVGRAAGGDPALNGIYTIRASDGGEVRRLTTNPYPPSGDFGGGDIPGDFSPDGSRFVFMRAKPGPEPTPDIGQSGALFVANSDGTGLRQITDYGLPNSHDNGLAHWSPNGQTLVFAGEQGELLLAKPDGTHLTRIHLQVEGDAFAFTPGWSPSGGRVVFSLFLRQSGQEDIYTADLHGGHLAQVTKTPEPEDFANWTGHR